MKQVIDQQADFTIPRTELERLRFVENAVTHGRSVYSGAVYLEDQRKFQVYVPVGNGKMGMFEGKPVEGVYWSKTCVDTSTDCHVELLHLLANQLTIRRVVHSLRAMECDIINMACVLAKFLMYFEWHQRGQAGRYETSKFYVTETEYFMGLTLSFYGLLYDVLNDVLDACRKPRLPNSLGKVLDRGIEVLVEERGLPRVMATFLADIQQPFAGCRKLRNDIYHHGKTAETVYVTDRGPGIGTDRPPFICFHDYLSADVAYNAALLPNEIGSLFYLVSKLVACSLGAGDALAKLLTSAFDLPPPITNSYRLFLRSPLVVHLNALDRYLGNVWIPTASIT
ncbi:MAG TPA: hypothetical protein VMH22_06480 [bacterium]|nr:hypothetical protein [bacterium]